MDKFIVSARKYRPQLFNTVVGQSHITTTLKNAIKSEQLAHAFLFCGPRGVGKTTCARILAKTINCENRTAEGEACNTCNSCVSFNEGTSMNIHELDAASNNSVDDIRALVEQVRFAPQAGEYKVYIIDEVHMLSSSAFNAFLKTLEEPPSYAIFILATTEKHKILPTILSRCQIFDFKRITTNDTVEHLQEICEKEHVTAEKAALQVIAQKSEGCMRDALSIMDKIVSFTGGELNYNNTLEHLNILDADYYFKLLNCMMSQDLAGAMLLFDDINRKGFEGDLVLNGLAEFMRNLLVCKDERAASLLETVESFKSRYVETAATISAGTLISALNILNDAEIGFKAARNKRLHVELVLIKLCYLQQAMELSADGSAVSKKKRVDSARAVPFRALKAFEWKPAAPAAANDNTGARLTVETAPPVTQPQKQTTPPPQTTSSANTAAKPASPKISGLAQMRSKFKNMQEEAKEIVARPLVMEELRPKWDEYAAMLKANKNAAGSVFDMAQLQLVDENSFYVKVNDPIQFRFIETNALNVAEFLKEKLQNANLQLFIAMEENKDLAPKIEIPLSSGQQFQKLTEQYPLIRELKERLKLNVDY